MPRKVAQPAKKSFAFWPLVVVVATVLGLVLSLPTAFSTIQCVAYGRYCQYAVFGPDADTVLPQNVRLLNARLRSSGDNSFERFDYLVRRGIFGNRIDVVALFAGQRPLIVDSIGVPGGTRIETLISSDGKTGLVAASSKANREAARATLFIHRIGDTFIRREHFIECRRSANYSPELSVRNLSLEPSARALTFDVTTNCGALDLNSSDYVQLDDRLDTLSASYVDHGDVVTLSFDENYYFERAFARRQTERSEQAAQSLHNADQVVEACLNEHGLSASRPFPSPQGLFVSVCQATAYVRSETVSRAWVIQRQRAVATAQEFGCYGLTDIAIVGEGSAVVALCERSEISYDTGQARFLGRLVTLVIGFPDGRRTEIPFQCGCRDGVSLTAFSFRDGALFFELGVNARAIRVAGRNIRLLEGTSEMENVSPSFPHGLFRLTLTDRLTFDSLSRVR